MRAGPDESRQDFVGLGNLLLNDPVHVWKCGEKSAQHVLQSGQTRPLSWKGRLLDNILRNVIAGRVELPTVQDLLNKTGDYLLASLGIHGPSSLVRLFVLL